MIEIIRGIEQGTPEWDALRIGSIGGTAIGKIAAEGKERKGYYSELYALAGEILSGIKKPSFRATPAMENGIEHEDYARQYYTFVTGREVDQVALVRNTDLPHRHVSPDGLVGDDGSVEIKNVIPSTFVEYVLSGSVPIAHIRQINWTLAITGRRWCDYVVCCHEVRNSCDPMVIKRFNRDERAIATLQRAAELFIEEMLALVEIIKAPRERTAK